MIKRLDHLTESIQMGNILSNPNYKAGDSEHKNYLDS